MIWEEVEENSEMNIFFLAVVSPISFFRGLSNCFPWGNPFKFLLEKGLRNFFLDFLRPPPRSLMVIPWYNSLHINNWYNKLRSFQFIHTSWPINMTDILEEAVYKFRWEINWVSLTGKAFDYFQGRKLICFTPQKKTRWEPLNLRH